MPTGAWTEARLRRLFESYRAKFFPGRLRGFRVVNRTVHEIAHANGFCKSEERQIIVDVASHKSDRDVRSTLLHEMAHAAAGARSRGHDSRFFEQLEHLLRSGAPLAVGLPENPHQQLLESVPARFPLCRKALRASYSRRQRWLRALAKESGFVEQIDVGAAFYQAGLNGVLWADALLAIGLRYGLLDVDMKPLKETRSDIPRYKRRHGEGATIRAQMEKSRAPTEHRLRLVT